MNHYVLFDVYGKYMGYTLEKKDAKKIVTQRENIQKLNIEKFTEKMLNAVVKQELYMSGGEIFNYCGIYLFENEEDMVQEYCFNYFVKTMDLFEGFLQSLEYIKFTDTELETIGKYKNMAIEMMMSIQEDYYTKDEQFKDTFDVTRLILRCLKKMYKGDKK